MKRGWARQMLCSLPKLTLVTFAAGRTGRKKPKRKGRFHYVCADLPRRMSGDGEVRDDGGAGQSFLGEVEAAAGASFLGLGLVAAGLPLLDGDEEPDFL